MVVLITGAGSPGTRGTVDSIQMGFLEYEEYGLFSVHDAPLFVYADCRELMPAPEEFVMLPAGEHDNYLESLKDVCQRHKVDVVVPQTSAEVRRLTDYEGPGGLVCGRAPADVDDKKVLLDRLPDMVPARYDLDWWPPSDGWGSVSDGVRRVVLKPLRSSGGRGVRILTDSVRDLSTQAREKDSRWMSFDEASRIDWDWPLLAQEYLPGPEWSVDCFVAEGIRSVVVRRRLSVRSGITVESEIVRSPLIEGLVHEAIDRLELRGVFGFQFRADADGMPRLLECNQRVQGTMIHSTLAGTNLIWAGVCRELDLPIVLRPPTIGHRFRREWGWAE